MVDAWGTSWVRNGTAAWDSTWLAGPEREVILAGGDEIDMYWTPSSTIRLLSGSATQITEGDSQVEGVALFVNMDAVGSFVAIVTASIATTGDAQLVPIPAGGKAWIAFGHPHIFALCTGGTATYAQAGYALK